MLKSLRKFDQSEVAQQKMKIIEFYRCYGEKATIEAFGADRRVVNRWVKCLDNSGGQLSSLVPLTTKPHTTRTPVTDYRIIDFIAGEREAHPGVGKEMMNIVPDWVFPVCLLLPLAISSKDTISSFKNRESVTITLTPNGHKRRLRKRNG